MARSTKQQEMETQMEVLKAQIALLTAQASRAPMAQSLVSARPSVGLRNISSYTVGIPSPLADEPDVQLLADIPGEPNVMSTAVVSHAMWQQIRRMAYVEQGLVVRDDSLVGDGYIKAPADGPNDISPRALRNRIPDPAAWIESRDDDSLKADVAALDCEAPLLRLNAEVQRRIDALALEFSDHPDVIKKALRALPMRYQMVDMYVRERLLEVSPWAKLRESREKETLRV